MMICTECNGNGFLQNGNNMNLDNSSGLTVAFTTLKQVPETTCPTCLGNGYQRGGSF
jgi:hypothetical protein